VDDVNELERRMVEIQSKGVRLKTTLTGMNRTLVEPRLEELRKEYSRLHTRWVAAKQQERLF
jgi:hypothetical protein